MCVVQYCGMTRREFLTLALAVGATGAAGALTACNAAERSIGPRKLDVPPVTEYDYLRVKTDSTPSDAYRTPGNLPIPLNN